MNTYRITAAENGWVVMENPAEMGVMGGKCWIARDAEDIKELFVEFDKERMQKRVNKK